MAPSVSVMEAGSGRLESRASRDATAEPIVPVRNGSKDMTPIQAVSHGPIVIEGIPTFSTHHEHRRHILIHTAAIFRDWARRGFTEGISGHISVRDPEFEDCMWMNPLGKHFGLMTAGDMICLDVKTGAIVGGNRSRPANRAGYLIHSEIHKARSDAHAICHAHTIAGRAWSTFGKPLEMITQDVCNFYNALAVYADYGGVAVAQEEGKNIAKAMGKASKGAILMNHGLITVGTTVGEAGFLFALLDNSCKIQLQVEAACARDPRLKKQIINDEQAVYNFKWASDKDSLCAEMQPDIDFVLETNGYDVVSRGVEDMKIDTENM